MPPGSLIIPLSSVGMVWMVQYSMASPGTLSICQPKSSR